MAFVSNKGQGRVRKISKKAYKPQLRATKQSLSHGVKAKIKGF